LAVSTAVGFARRVVMREGNLPCPLAGRFPAYRPQLLCPAKAGLRTLMRLIIRRGRFLQPHAGRLLAPFCDLIGIMPVEQAAAHGRASGPALNHSDGERNLWDDSGLP
jgi:hypothetical protein